MSEHPVATRYQTKPDGKLRSGPHKLSRAEKDFAIWLVDRSHPVHLDRQVEKAEEIIGRPFTAAEVRGMKRSKAFKTFITSLRGDPVEAARIIFDEESPKAVSTHFRAIDELADQGQWEKAGKLTSTVVDRIVPKKSGDGNIQATQVIINITPAQQALIDTDPEPIEVEVIEDAAESD